MRQAYRTIGLDLPLPSNARAASRCLPGARSLNRSGDVQGAECSRSSLQANETVAGEPVG